MSRPEERVPPGDARYKGPIGGVIVPGLTGIAASGLFVAAWAVAGGAGALVAPLILIGGAVLLGIVVGNPGNEGVTLAGTLLPGVLLFAFESQNDCLVQLGPLIFLSVGLGIGLMFFGLVLGLIVGRRAGIQPVRQPVAVGVLAAASLVAASAWLALGTSLASGTVC